MTKLSEYQQKKENIQQRLQDARTAYDKVQAEVKELEAEYQQIVQNGKDKEADALFKKLDNKRQEGRGCDEKYRLLAKTYHDQVKPLAVEAVQEIESINQQYHREKEPVLQEVEDAKAAYVAACKKAIQYNTTYAQAADAYEDVFEVEGLQRQDIGNKAWTLVTTRHDIIQPNFDLKGVPYHA